MSTITARNLISILTITIIALASLPSTGLSQQKTYTLDDCIEMALRNNYTVAQAEGGVKRSEADLLAAKGAFLPNLGLDLSGRFIHEKKKDRYFDSNRNEWVEGSYTSGNQIYSLGVASEWVLFDGFSRFYELSRSKAALKADRHNLSDAKLSLIYDVKVSYYALLEAQSILDIRSKALERSQETMRIAETKYELGSASKSDVLKAKVSLSQAQLDLLTAENEVKSDQAALNYILGEDIGTDIKIEDIELSDQTFEPMELERAALQNNPDYLRAVQETRSAKSELGYWRSYWYPDLAFQVSRSWGDRDINNIGDWTDASYTNSAWIGLSFNIFNRFQTKRNTDRAKASLNTSEYVLNDTKRAVELEAWQAYLNLEEKAEARNLADQTLESAQEDFKLEQEKYALGAATILDILDAEVNLKDAEADVIVKRYEYYLAIARVQKVMGIAE
jgi:outer membrane protein